MIKSLIKNLVPTSIKQKRRSEKLNRQKDLIQSLPKISESDFVKILKDDLGIVSGDTLFIHSSTSYLNLDFQAYLIINILMDLVGENGTIVFPAYPKLSSYDFLRSGEVFNIKKTPTFTGLLNEYARRHKMAVRSLHPTKSCVAIGKNAVEITNQHEKSPYPYDTNSPYYKITEFNAKIIGIGVKSTYLSCVHCVDDIMKERYPVNPYHKKMFSAKCLDYSGTEVFVNTYAHDISKMDFDIPGYMKKNIKPDVCRDLQIDGYDFFTANAKSLIEEMLPLAEEGITIYKRWHYKLKYLFS